MKSQFLLVCLFALALVSASELKSKLSKYTRSASEHESMTSLDTPDAPNFQAGFIDALLGWTYPTYTDQCKTKARNILTDYFAVLKDVFTGQFSNVQSDLKDIVAQYRAFPRCYLFTNVPTAVGISVTYTSLLRYALNPSNANLGLASLAAFTLMTPFFVLYYIPDKIFDYITIIVDTIEVITSFDTDTYGIIGELVGGWGRVYLDGVISVALINATSSLY